MPSEFPVTIIPCHLDDATLHTHVYRLPAHQQWNDDTQVELFALLTIQDRNHTHHHYDILRTNIDLITIKSLRVCQFFVFFLFS
jgi:hypothetical protein